MKYRIKKETKPTLLTYGKYKAVAVHNQTIESRQIFEEAVRHLISPRNHSKISKSSLFLHLESLAKGWL